MEKKKLIPEVARKLGYDFTDEEFKEILSKSKELTDDEIEQVTGGKGEGQAYADFFMWVYCGFNHHYVPTGKTTVKYDVVIPADFYEVKCLDCGHETWKRGTPPDIKGPKINPNIDVRLLKDKEQYAVAQKFAKTLSDKNISEKEV